MFPGTVTYADCNQGAIEVKLDGTGQTVSVALKERWFGELPFVGTRILCEVGRDHQITSSRPIEQLGTLDCELEEFDYCRECAADTPHRRVLSTMIDRNNMYWVRVECTLCGTRKTEHRKAEFVGRCKADRTERLTFCRVCAAITPWRTRDGICTLCEKRGVFVTIPRRRVAVRESIER